MSALKRSEPRGGLVVARVAVGLLLLASAFLILRPFLVPAIWAAVVAFMTFGPYARVRDASGRPNATAMLFTLVVFLLLGIPTVLLFVAVIDGSINLVGAVQDWLEAGAQLPVWLTENRFVGPRIQSLQEHGLPGFGDVAPRLVQLGKSLSQYVVSIAGGVAGNVFAFLVTLLLLYVFYIDGQVIAAKTRRLIVFLFPSRSHDFLDEIGKIVRGVVLGVVGTAVIQGTVAGIGYAIFGIPHAAGLGALTMLLSFLPGGTFIASAGAVAWLASQGATGAAVGQAAWGFLLVGSLDNFLRPILIRASGGAEIPFVLVLFGVLGGLSAFGLLGLLIGPVVLAVTFALVTEIPRAEDVPDLPGGAAATRESARSE